MEERFVHLKEGQYTMTPEEAVALVDENTIGIAAILGSTYNGEFDDIAALNDKLAEKNKEVRKREEGGKKSSVLARVSIDRSLNPCLHPFNHSLTRTHTHTLFTNADGLGYAHPRGRCFGGLHRALHLPGLCVGLQAPFGEID